VPDERIAEINFVHISTIQEPMRSSVERAIAAMLSADRQGYQGYVKTTYVTASPRKVGSIEPIAGTPIECYRAMMKGMDFAAF
jgi:predicted transcriptional regulator